MNHSKKNLRVVSAEIQNDGKYLITQRSEQAVLPLLWEFPGGRVRQDESDEQTLKRSVSYRLGLSVEVHEKLMEVSHDYDDYTVVLAVYSCSIGSQTPHSEHVNAFAWVNPLDFADYQFPGADQHTVKLLLSDEDR